MKQRLKEAYEEHGAQLLAVCRRYTPNLQTAEDMFQDGFMSAFKAAQSFKGTSEAELYAWLRTIMVNTCLMRIRKNDILKDAADVEFQSEVPDDDVGYERIDQQTLIEMISTLPVSERTVLNLFVFEDLSHKEIAQKLGITEKASINKMYRAKAMLAEKIRNYER